MKRSRERILTTHTGSLPRPPQVVELMLHEQNNPGAKAAELKATVRRAVADVVARQVACGLDVINDGEQGRTDYTTHVKDRLTGFDGPSSPPLGTGEPDFPELSAMLAYFASPFQHRPACSGPVEWKDFAALEADIALAKEATAGAGAADVFFTSPSPGQIAPRTSSSIPSWWRTASCNTRAWWERRTSSPGSIAASAPSPAGCRSTPRSCG
jgi:5-methyltetrahydropteroyltriglutamate--homocysteine methyltransferase